jgi:hypothetical protein
MSGTTIDYTTVAEAVWTAISTRGPKGELSRDELDTILSQAGLKPASAGSTRRDTWNIWRNIHRQRFNRVMNDTRGITLEVIRPGNSRYTLVAAADKMIGDPFRRSVKFYGQMMRFFDMVKDAIETNHAPPPGLSEDGLTRWQALNKRRFERVMADYLDTLEQNTLAAGFQSHIPLLPDNIVDLREGRAKRRRRG